MHLTRALFVLVSAVLAGAMPAYARGPVAAVPTGNPGAWITSSDYPSEALRFEQEGIVGFRATISADGRATQCEIVSSSTFPSLDAATCRLVMLRARFNPALDSAGKATVGTYQGRVRWTVPIAEPDQISEFHVVWEMLVGPDGTVRDCHAVRLDGAPPPFVRQCPPGNRLVPFRDDYGNPITKKLRMIMAAEVSDP